MIETIRPPTSVSFLPHLPTSLTQSFPVARLPMTTSVPRFRAHTAVQTAATFPAVDTRLSTASLKRRTSSQISTSTNLNLSTSSQTSWPLSLRINNVKLLTMQMILPLVSRANSPIKTLGHLSVKGVHSLVSNLQVRDCTQMVNRIRVSWLVTSTALPPTYRMAASRELLHTVLPPKNSHRKRIPKNTLPTLQSVGRDCTLWWSLSSKRTSLVLVIEMFGKGFTVLDSHAP